MEMSAADRQMAEKQVPILGKNQITAEEAKARECIIYKGAAYDVSSYAAQHPGGEAMLTSRLGEDVADEFEALGHSDQAMAILETLYVADAVADEEAGAKKRSLWSVPLKLTSSRQLTSSAWELVFQWESQQEMLSLAPGKHVKLTAKHASKADSCSRSYTPVHFDAEARTVTLGIKFYEKGEMSQLLRRAVAKADEFTFSMAGPLGEIDYEEKEIASGGAVFSSSEHLVLIAGGTGIMLRAKKIASKRLTLVYCAKTTDDLMYEKEIQALLPPEYNLRILCPINRETSSAQVVDAVSSDAAPSNDVACVVCGPPGMEEAVRVALTHKGYTQVLTSTSSVLKRDKPLGSATHGGATAYPQVVVDGKRPFHLYPPTSEVFVKAVWFRIREPLLPTFCAAIFWPLYEAFATSIQQNWGWSEQSFFTLIFCIMNTLAYAFFNGFYAVIEHQRWLERYKIDREPHHLGTIAMARANVSKAARGRLLVGPIIIYFVVGWIFSLVGILQRTFTSRPSLSEFYVCFMVCSLINDVIFSFAHRLLHSKAFYAKYHKQHHEWKGTVSLSAENATFVEVLLSGYIPSLLGPTLLAVHPWTFCVFVVERLRKTYEVHSGYAFRVHPVLEFFNITNATAAAEHDFHHTGNSGNFSSSNALWLDWKWGTMDAWVVAGQADKYLESKAQEKLSYMRG